MSASSLRDSLFLLMSYWVSLRSMCLNSLRIMTSMMDRSS